MKIKAVINPVAGRNAKRNVTFKVIGTLKEKGLISDAEILYTSENNSSQELAAFLENCGIAMVSGGDGTLNRVVNAIKEFNLDVPVAYLPTGSTNDFGTSMKLPKNAKAFTQMLLEPEFFQVDIGLAGESYFHNVAAGGALTQVSYTTDQKLKNRIGHAAYVFSALGSLPKYMCGTKLQLDCEQLHAQENALLLLVSNSGRIGGFGKMIPEAQMDDGYLHVMIVRKPTPMAIPGLLLSVLRGNHAGRPEIEVFKTKELEISSVNEKDLIGLDGEIGGGYPTRMQIIPKGLKIVVPRT